LLNLSVVTSQTLRNTLIAMLLKFMQEL